MIINIKNKVVSRNLIKINYKIIVSVNHIQDNRETYNFKLFI